MATTAPVPSCLLRFFMSIAAAFALVAALVPVAYARTADRMSVEVVGQGPDVIMVPGFASTREVWRATAEQLSSRYRVHLVQLSGFGEQPWGQGDAPFLQPAMDELATYAETLDRPAYIGHSMGGVIGVKLAQDQPQLFSKVMSVDSLPFYGSLFSPTATVDALRPAAAQVKSAILGVPDEAFRQQ